MPLLRAVLILALLLAPGAAGAWVAHGHSEPDPGRDTSDRMWTDPPGDAQRRVYFHAYPTSFDTDTNPHLAITSTRPAAPGHVRFEAILGVWADCNDDGAIGMLDVAQERYPPELLLDDTRCPPGGEHNRGGLVRELLPIGRGPDAWLHDQIVRVWGDAGEPGAPGVEACTAYPLPRGATSNTGRMLRVVDCALEHRVIGAVNTVDNDGGLGLRIDDAHHPEEAESALVQDVPVSPFYDPNSGQHGVLDADAPPTFELADCGAGDPRVADDPTDASLWTALDRLVATTSGDCGAEGPLAPYHPGLEQPFEPGSHVGRDRNDVVMTYGRTANPSVGFEPWHASRVALDVQPPSATTARWRALTAFTPGPHTLTRSATDPFAPTIWTFYAAVGDATLAHARLPSTAPSPYGDEACAGESEGIRGGWTCDAAAWWRDPAGDAMPTDGSGRPWGARAGDLYHLRDVDVYRVAASP